MSWDKGNEPPVLLAGMKVQFLYNRSWYVGEILRFEGENVLIEHQQKRINQSRKRVHRDDVRPLLLGTPKSAIAP